MLLVKARTGTWKKQMESRSQSRGRLTSFSLLRESDAAHEVCEATVWHS